jgi:nicotinate-nucleotide adenylyltransferase
LSQGPTRLGVLGGAFDPPHLAHVALARAAIEQLQLDELRVLPTGQAWHKARTLTPAIHRLAMTRLAFAEVPKAVVDDRETRRAGATYTVDTLRELRAEHPLAELFLILGQDQADALDTWHEWEEILRLAIICVADRGGLTRESPRFVPSEAMASRFRRLQMPLTPISATEIRSRVATRQDILPLVSGPVARYIEHHHLYPAA